jgi:hypothetical protein
MCDVDQATPRSCTHTHGWYLTIRASNKKGPERGDGRLLRPVEHGAVIRRTCAVPAKRL